MAVAQQVDFLISGVVDSNGNVLSGGKVYFYKTDGTTFGDIFEDAGATAPLENPVTLDAKGCATVFANGTYNIVIKNKNNVPITYPYPLDEVTYKIPNSETEIGIYVRNFGPPTASTVVLAMDSVLGGKADLIFSPESWDLNIDLTIPSNIRCVYPMGFNWYSSNGRSITYNGFIAAPQEALHSDSINNVTLNAQLASYPSIWNKVGSGSYDTRNWNFTKDVSVLGVLKTQDISVAGGKNINGGKTLNDLLKIQGWNTSTLEYAPFVTITAGNPPLFDLNTSTTIGGQPIATTGSSPTFANVTISNGGALRTSTGAGNTLRLQAYDVDNTAYSTFLTLTAGNSPTCDLSALVTVGGTPLIALTTLGVVTSGTWQASTIAALYGGTGQSSYAVGDLLYASGAATLSKLAGNTSTTTKALLQTGVGLSSAAPVWTEIPLSITGTLNQVIASASVGAITLSLPQSIATTSDVTFNSLNLTNNITVGTTLFTTRTDLNKVGVGVSGPPRTLLDVAGPIALNEDAADNNFVKLCLYPGADVNTSNRFFAGIYFSVTSGDTTYTSPDHQFYYDTAASLGFAISSRTWNGTSYDISNVFRVAQNGNVGLGNAVSNPLYTLDLGTSGTFRANSVKCGAGSFISEDGSVGQTFNFTFNVGSKLFYKNGILVGGA